MSCVEKECLFYRRHSEITEMSLDGANELECMEYYSGSLLNSKLVHSSEFPLYKVYGYSDCSNLSLVSFSSHDITISCWLCCLSVHILSYHIKISCRMELVPVTPYLIFFCYVIGGPDSVCSSFSILIFHVQQAIDFQYLLLVQTVLPRVFIQFPIVCGDF